MKGIKDILENQRWQTKHLMSELKSNNVPGNWESYQNIYNLVDGSVKPKDPFVYIVLSKMFKMKVEEVIERYSDINLPSHTTENENKKVIIGESDDIIVKEKNINW
jgi:hypothetical protein